MRIYLAGKPEEHERFNEYATEIRNDGFEVVSCWHESDQIANLVSGFQTTQDNQLQFLTKFMRIVTGQDTAGDEISNSDRSELGSGPSAFEIEDAFSKFKRAIKARTR